MTEMNCCRLCLLPNSGEHFNIFSSIAVEMHMCDIISEHFKYPIGEDDSLPRFVCQGCWSTTDAFHELYLKSQSAQEVLNPLIKVEPQTDDVLEIDQILECSALEIDDVKFEQSEELDIDDDQFYNDDSDENGENEQNSSHSDEKSKGTAYSKLPTKQKKIIIKKKRDEFEKLFNQHKHLFDMKCDQCATVFDSYADARKHYIEEHNVRKGYIKCCNIKLFYVSDIRLHILKHEDPDQFKCTICSNSYTRLGYLKKHMQSHIEQPVRLVCEICKKTFSMKTTLDRHMKCHEKDQDEEQKYKDFISQNFDMKCDLCDTIFTTFYESRAHYKEIHNEPNGYLKCCNKKLTAVCIIKEHIKLHWNPDELRCDVCGKMMASRMILRTHKIRHERKLKKMMLRKQMKREERLRLRDNLICDICKRVFVYKDTLESHLKQHVQNNEEEQKYRNFMSENFDMKCDLCDTICCTFYDARSHYKDKHNEDNGYIKCCNKKLTASWAVKDHITNHLYPETLKCDLCGKYMASRLLLQKHKKSHERKLQRIKVRRQVQKEQRQKARLNLICDICKKVFVSKASLEKHMKRHGEGNEEELEYAKFMSDTIDMSCDLCDTVFITLHEARRHYKELHNVDKGYIKCCGIKMKEYWIVKQHIQSHINPDTFKCDVCDKSFSSGMVLVQHKRRHQLTMNKTVICDFCGRNFRDKDAILRHLFTRHVNTEPTHECDICHKKFRLPALLKNHFYSVHREKKHNHTCEICGKGFHVKFHLKKHMLSHTDKSERLSLRKQCEYCGEWLMTKSGIYYHEQIHTSGVQKCQHCDMELPNKVALLGHIRHHHREHKFKCDYCGKTFSTQSTMKKHEESHTRHNEYPCKFCDKKFSVMSSRRTHVRRNHHEEAERLRKMNK